MFIKSNSSENKTQKFVLQVYEGHEFFFFFSLFFFYFTVEIAKCVHLIKVLLRHICPVINKQIFSRCLIEISLKFIKRWGA